MPPERDKSTANTDTSADSGQNNDKVVEPGQTGDDGKYTDEGLDALVNQLKNTDDDGSTSDNSVSASDDSDDGDTGDDSDNDNGDNRSKFIPRNRFDQVNSRLRELEEENARLKQQGTSAQQTQAQTNTPTVESLRGDLKSARKAWQDALMSQDGDEAAKQLSIIDDLEEQIDTLQTSLVSQTVRAQSSDDIKYDALLDSLMTTYPAIRKGAKEFNQDVVNDMYEMREAFVGRGYSQTDALRKAAKFVLEPMGQTQQSKDTTTTRTQTARKNTADALQRQPPNVTDLGGSSDRGGSNALGIDISRLTQEQFDRLPDEVKSKLRGDELKPHHMDARGE